MQKKKKSGWKTVLLSLFLGLVFIVGLIFTFNEPIKRYLVRNMTKESLTTLQKEKPKVAHKKKKENFDFSKVKPLTFEDIAKERANLKKNLKQVTYLGKIIIPSVHIKLPILEGVSNTVLSIGAGTLKADETMGKGNYALASHNMNDRTTLFSPLVDIQKGALMYTMDDTTVYQYRVQTVRYIQPTDTAVIANQKGKTLLSLITCNYTGSQRLLVQGTFVKKMPIAKAGAVAS